METYPNNNFMSGSWPVDKIYFRVLIIMFNFWYANETYVITVIHTDLTIINCGGNSTAGLPHTNK